MCEYSFVNVTISVPWVSNSFYRLHKILNLGRSWQAPILAMIQLDSQTCQVGEEHYILVIPILIPDS